jgi:hypothetical protein
MQKIGFAEALDSIVGSDPRYQREAYIFLRDALDFTTKAQKKAKGTTVRQRFRTGAAPRCPPIRAQRIRPHGGHRFRTAGESGPVKISATWFLI